MIQTIALNQGWSQECLAGCLVSNMGFMEHEATRLALGRQTIHTVTPNVPILIAANSSARKSSLIAYSTKLMTSENSPCEGLREGREVILQVATMKGIKKSPREISPGQPHKRRAREHLSHALERAGLGYQLPGPLKDEHIPVV